MIKICFVVPRAYYLFNNQAKDIADKIGGAQKQTYLLSLELASINNFDVNFIVADFGQNKIEKYDNVTVYKSFNFKHNILKRFNNLFKTIKQVNADFYIFRASDLGVAIFIFFVKKYFRKKVIYMIAHDSETNFKNHKKISGFWGAFLMQKAYKIADKITAQSVQQFDLFYNNFNKKPDVIIKNIIDLENNLENYVRDKILWIGRLDKFKNPEIFLKLIDKFPNNKFVMLAPIEYNSIDYGLNLQKIIKSKSNIEYIEFVQPTEIYMLYQQAKIYVMTSEAEGFSNTMLEAIANVCPILSYKVNNDNIFDNQKIGFCANGELELFYKYFNILNNNFFETPDFKAECENYLNKNHNKTEIIENFVKLFYE